MIPHELVKNTKIQQNHHNHNHDEEKSIPLQPKHKNNNPVNNPFCKVNINPDYYFFESLKKFLDDEELYKNFLKLLNLYIEVIKLHNKFFLFILIINFFNFLGSF